MPTWSGGAPGVTGRWEGSSWGVYPFGYYFSAFKPGAQWASVAVPQGATITSATLGFKLSNGVQSGAVGVHQVDNAPALGNGQNTTGFTPTGGWPSGPGTFTVDLTAGVQALVDRPGWAAGNALTVRWEGVGSSSGNATLSAVTLTIEYQDPSTDYVLTVGDTIGVEDTTSVALGLARTVHDDIPVVDDAQSLMPMSREATDQVAIGDTATPLLVPGTPRTATDSVPVVDQVTVGYHPANTPTTTDLVSIVDQVAVSLVTFAPPPPPWQDVLADPAFLAAVRMPHRVSDWRAQIISPDGTPLGDLPVTPGGPVSCDGQRRHWWESTLHVPDPDWYPHHPADPLHPYSRHTIQLWWRLRLPQTGAWVETPVGRYHPTITGQAADGDDAPQGFQVQGYSSLAMVRHYLTPLDVGGMRLHTAIETILRATAPWLRLDLTPSMDSMPTEWWAGQPYGGDPVADCHTIAAAGGMRLYEDPTGVIRLEPLPPAQATEDWSTGIVKAIRVSPVDETAARNTVRVAGNSRDLEVPVWATAQTTDPTDPLSLTHGQIRPLRVDNPVINSTGQAQAYADSELALSREQVTEVDLVILPQPHLLPGVVAALHQPAQDTVGPHRATGWVLDTSEDALMGVTMTGVDAT